MAPAPCTCSYSPRRSRSRGLSLLGLAFVLFGKADGGSTSRILALRTACGISDDSVSVSSLFCGGTSHCQDAILDLAETLDDSGAPRYIIFSAYSSGCPLPTYEPTRQSSGARSNQLPTEDETSKGGAFGRETSSARQQSAVDDGGIIGSWAADSRSIVELVRRLQASLTEVTHMPDLT